jgi:hypothetical protein
LKSNIQSSTASTPTQEKKCLYFCKGKESSGNEIKSISFVWRLKLGIERKGRAKKRKIELQLSLVSTQIERKIKS